MAADALEVALSAALAGAAVAYLLYWLEAVL